MMLAQGEGRSPDSAPVYSPTWHAGLCGVRRRRGKKILLLRGGISMQRLMIQIPVGEEEEGRSENEGG